MAQDVRIAVGRLSRQLRRIYGQGRDDAEPSFLELALLLRVRRDGAASTGALAQGEGVTAQAVSAALGGLRAAGLVEVGTDPDDRRRSRIAITTAGERLLDDRERRIGDRLARAVAEGFDRAELARLAAAAPLLDRLADLLADRPEA